jgi:hypothetical protein
MKKAGGLDLGQKMAIQNLMSSQFFEGALKQCGKQHVYLQKVAS